MLRQIRPRHCWFSYILGRPADSEPLLHSTANKAIEDGRTTQLEWLLNEEYDDNYSIIGLDVKEDWLDEDECHLNYYPVYDDGEVSESCYATLVIKKVQIH